MAAMSLSARSRSFTYSAMIMVDLSLRINIQVGITTRCGEDQFCNQKCINLEVPLSLSLLKSMNAFLKLAYQIRSIFVYTAHRLFRVDVLIQVTIMKTSNHIYLVWLQIKMSSLRQQNLNLGKVDDGRLCLRVVDSSKFLESASSQPSLGGFSRFTVFIW